MKKQQNRNKETQKARVMRRKNMAVENNMDDELDQVSAEAMPA